MTRPAIKQPPTPDTNPTDRDKLRHWLSSALVESQRLALITQFWGKDAAAQARGHGLQIDACTRILTTLAAATPTPQAGDELARELEALAERAGINHADPMQWEPCGEAICDKEHGFRIGVMTSEIFPTGIDEANAELVSAMVNNLPRILSALTASGNDVLRELLRECREWFDANGCGRDLPDRILTALSTTPTMSAEDTAALPEYDKWLPDVWDDYLAELVGREHVRHWLPATFRWHEFYERLATAIRSLPLAKEPTK